MSGILELITIRSALKQLPEIYGVRAASDPTMLFSGLVWGADIFVKQGLMYAQWPLKTALFQCGDEIVEAVINAVGLSEFKQHFESHKSSDEFYLFDSDHVKQADKILAHQCMREGYENCVSALNQYFPVYQEAIKYCWVLATNKAIESTFTVNEWSKSLKEKNVSDLYDIARSEEENKNVKVVCTLVDGANALGKPFSYRKNPEDLIRASSRWFTLLDDFLDVKKDYLEKQPNYLHALLIKHGEWDDFLYSIESITFNSFESKFYRTYDDYKKQLQIARSNFKKLFPVLPSFFTWWVEREAKKRGKSPF